jgi:DNA segregation ATPase FtsK/SpoIIIE, S-DNA-T family
MELRLTLVRSAGARDVLVTVDPTVTAGELAARLQDLDPDADAPASGRCTLAVAAGRGWTTVPAVTPVAQVGLRSGLSITVIPVGVPASVGTGARVLAVVEALTGPDAGREFPLPEGVWTIGRGQGSDVALNDPLRIGREVRLTDQNSANGTQVHGAMAASARLDDGARVTVGDTELRIRLLQAGNPGTDLAEPQVAFIRSPRVEPEFVPLDETIPDPPQRQPGQPFPFFSILISAGLGLLLWQLTKNLLTSVFLALTSLLLLGSVLEQGMFGRRAHRRARAAYRADVAARWERFALARDAESTARRSEHPSVAEVRVAVVERTPLLWSRRPDQDRFGQVRLGTAARPSRSRLVPPDGRGDRDLLAEADAASREFLDVPDVPVVADLRDGALGVCGPDGLRQDAAGGVVLQLVGLHSPEEVVLSAVIPESASADWGWLRWLPHVAAAGPGGSPLAADPESCGRVVDTVEQLVHDRSRRATHRDPGAPNGEQVHLLLVDDGAPVERGRLVALAERGTRVGVLVLWSAPATTALPAACSSYLEVRTDGGVVGHTRSGELEEPVRVEPVDAALADSLARLLAPVVDASARVDRQAALPRTASFVEYVGREVVQGPTQIVQRWRDRTAAGDCRDPPSWHPARARRPGRR